MQAVLLEAEQRRQEVGDDPLGAGLDLDGHRHAGRERHIPAVDRHRGAVERDVGGIDQLMALRLAGAVGTLGARLLAVRFKQDSLNER